MVRYLNQDFELHPSGRGVSEEMAFFGTHEPVATEAYLEHLREGDHVLDVGANLGYYLLLAARSAGEGCIRYPGAECRSVGTCPHQGFPLGARRQEWFYGIL